MALMGAGTETQGVILVNCIKSLDLQARQAKKIEHAPAFIMDEVLAILDAIISG